ncbi:MAG: type 4a pilus biogenesis protein PilO [Candidatus Eisenbacteria bacterium]
MTKAIIRAPWFGHALVLASLVVALGVVNAAWIAPREKERRVLATRETTLRTELTDLQAGLGEIEAWQRAHPATDGMRGRLKRALPAGTMVASLLDALAAVSVRHGVRTELIRPAGLPVEEVIPDASGAAVAYRKVDLRLRLEAPYQAIGNYLADVESLDQLVVVRSVALRHEASLAPRLVADVSLWIYGSP